MSLLVASLGMKISEAIELVIGIVGRERILVGCLTAVEQIRFK